MPAPSSRRTRAPGVRPVLGHRKYREKWPDLHLKTGTLEDRMQMAPGRTLVALVDSGVPEGYTGPGGDPTTRRDGRDDDGHAAMLAATINRGDAISRRAIEVRAVKCFPAQGWPKPEHGIEAIRQAIEMQAKVIVLAWDTGHDSPALEAAILAARTAPTPAVVVIAAGNWSLDNDRHPNWPANYCRKATMDHVITVMATDDHDECASYSSYGHESVFIAAPGTAKLDSAVFTSRRGPRSLKNAEREFRGTSAATAHVARLAALLLAKEPNLTPQQVRERLCQGARVVPALEKLCVTGRIIDFDKTLT